LAARICTNEVGRPLHHGKGTRTSKADDRCSLQVVNEAYGRDGPTAYIRTHGAGAGADGKEINILHGGCLQTAQNRAATGFHGAAQIALIQWLRAFPAIQSAFQTKKAMINIASQEDLPNAPAMATRGMKAFLLGEPNPRVRCSDAEDARMVH
jgi:hypothetical protein